MTKEQRIKTKFEIQIYVTLQTLNNSLITYVDRYGSEEKPLFKKLQDITQKFLDGGGDKTRTDLIRIKL